MRVLFATIGSLGELPTWIATNSVHRARVEVAGVEWRRMRPETPAPELFARAMSVQARPSRHAPDTA